MRYDTKNEVLARHAREYLERLISSGATVEVKQVRKSRTPWQNKYFHVIVKLFSDHTGYETEESKTIIKRSCGLHYRKGNQVFLKSTSDLDVAEFSEFLDKVIRWCAMEHNIVVPDSEQYK